MAQGGVIRVGQVIDDGVEGIATDDFVGDLGRGQEGCVVF